MRAKLGLISRIANRDFLGKGWRELVSPLPVVAMVAGLTAVEVLPKDPTVPTRDLSIASRQLIAAFAPSPLVYYCAVATCLAATAYILLLLLRRQGISRWAAWTGAVWFLVLPGSSVLYSDGSGTDVLFLLTQTIALAAIATGREQFGLMVGGVSALCSPSALVWLGALAVNLFFAPRPGSAKKSRFRERATRYGVLAGGVLGVSLLSEIPWSLSATPLAVALNSQGAHTVGSFIVSFEVIFFLALAQLAREWNDEEPVRMAAMACGATWFLIVVASGVWTGPIFATSFLFMLPLALRWLERHAQTLGKNPAASAPFLVLLAMAFSLLLEWDPRFKPWQPDLDVFRYGMALALAFVLETGAVRRLWSGR